MANNYFRFKQFTIQQEKAAMKVGTDGILLGAWADVSACKRILDVGTGTGLIALMLAQRSEAIVTAIEIEKNATEQARENVSNSSWSSRVIVDHISFQEFEEKSNGFFDLIVSNPPFFRNSLKANGEERTLARHNDSLSFEELISGSYKMLSSVGKLAVILPFEAKEDFMNSAAVENLFLVRQTIIHPEESKKANRVLLELSKKKTVPQENRLVIYSDQKVYSNSFTELTRNFYLHF